MIVFFDFETGGVLDSHPNIQLAAIAVDESSDWAEVATYESKILFNLSEADPEALRINHYTAEAWSEAVPEKNVCVQFSAFLKRFAEIECVSKSSGSKYNVCRIAGHNAATFDGPRLRQMFARHKQFLPAHPVVLCTMQRALWWARESQTALPNVKLATVCEQLGIALDHAHDALHDCRASAAIARHFARERVAV